VELQADGDPDADDRGRVTLFIKSFMKPAIADAVRAAGAAGLEMGGWLSVTYTANGTAKQRGMNPPKLYEAEYKPPALDAGADDDAPF
jgi:hypothetical protein